MTANLADVSFWLVTQAARATAVLALAGVAHVALRHRASAATRHFIWTIAACALLALPVLSAIVPAWHVGPNLVVAGDRSDAAIARGVSPVADADVVATNATPNPSGAAVGAPEAPRHDPAVHAATAESRRARIAATLIAVYFAGVALLLARIGRHHRAARRIASTAAPLTAAAWSRLAAECARQLSITRPFSLRRGAGSSMPMAVGVVRPAIVVPDAADAWDEDRRRAVLLHELAHVGRRDCLTQLLASLACALYWPHPAAWWMARQLRVERELACDDRVLTAGAAPRDYAGHLLEIAYSLGRGRAPVLAVSMARQGQLEGRMLAVLDSARNRALPGTRARLAVILTAAALVLPLAAIARGTAPVVADAALTITDDTMPLPPSGEDEGIAIAGSNVAREAPSAPAQDEVPAGGAWTLKPAKQPGTVHLEMREEQSSSGTTAPLAVFSGLSESQLTGTGGPVRFMMRRDAGTFTFEGHVRNGVGGGTYSYAPNPAFAGELEKRGVSRPTAREQYEMAKHDVGLALVDELQSQGYPEPTSAQLVRAGHHGARLDYVREMGQLGYKVGSLEALIKMRDHGVTPAYVRELLALGLPKLGADDIVRVRDHGVTPAYVKGLADAGYTKLSIDELVTTRDHGVTPEYVRRMAALGYAKLPLQDIVKTRDHGVTPEYVEKLAALGHVRLSLDEIVRTRDHGVTPEYIERLSALGYTKLALEQIINTRNHGVTPEYVDGMKALGYGNLPLEALVRARDHGVTPEYISGLKAQGYDTLSLDEVITLRDHGVTPEKVKSANERAGTRLPLDMIRQLAGSGGLR